MTTAATTQKPLDRHPRDHAPEPLSGHIDDLVARQRFAHSLEQPFYLDPFIFDLDVSRVLSTQWLAVAHTSELARGGDWLTVTIVAESVIVVRDRNDQIHAHFNVCRHRGSRICSQTRGNSPRLVCPYHAWAYDHDGALRLARQMPPTFDPSAYALNPCGVRVLHGLIFISLDEQAALDFEILAANVEPFLEPHGLERTKPAATERFEVAANWKLVVENFRECYHCSPSHPEYTAVNAYVRATDKALDGYAPVVDAWRAAYPDTGMKTSYEEFDSDIQPHHAWRMPIRDGFLTASEHGQPVAPLLGNFDNYDGAETVLFISPLSYLYLNNDYGAMFRVVPQTATTTAVDVTWLVHEDANLDTDVDIDALTWLWRQTTIQDVRIVEENHRGVQSRAYEPGPYSLREPGTVNFVSWYLAALRGDPASRQVAPSIADKGQSGRPA